MNKFAVFFPGIGYHYDKPLLYNARRLALEAGYEKYINVAYSFQAQNLRGNSAKIREAVDILLQQTEAALCNVQRAVYDDILFVSKSIGTAVAVSYAQRHTLECRHILYTPLEESFDNTPKNAIAFSGTSDPWVSQEQLTELCKKAAVQLTTIDGANHSLETSDALKNIDILKQVMTESKNFIFL